MSDNPAPPADLAASADPGEFGIGLRYSLHPASDNFVDVILGAISATEQAGVSDGLTVQTDEVSTLVRATRAPAEQLLADYLTRTVAEATARMNGGHLVTHVLFSRGCPGEITCEIGDLAPPEVSPITLEPTGVDAVAQWSLYPLMDGGSAHGPHLAPIERAIEQARAADVRVEASNFSTRLRGDLAAVVATMTNAWAGVGTEIPHVVTHATISINSPSPKEQS